MCLEAFKRYAGRHPDYELECVHVNVVLTSRFANCSVAGIALSSSTRGLLIGILNVSSIGER